MSDADQPPQRQNRPRPAGVRGRGRGAGHNRNAQDVLQWQNKDNVPNNIPFTGNPGCKVPNFDNSTSSFDIFSEFITPELIL